MKRKKNMAVTIMLFVMLLLGFAIMLYPIYSDILNRRENEQALTVYDRNVNALDNTQYKEILRQAHEYNKRLASLPNGLYYPDPAGDYDNTLKIGGTDIMGYITIDKINVHLPIYHGTSDEVLAVGAGHLKGSSMPVGGESTHAVITSHRGLPSARLFTDLDQLVIGDRFTVTVLGETLTYEVDKIEIILPTDWEHFEIVDGEDLVTLFTCTPYAVNSHRLIVRGHRVKNSHTPGSLVIPADAVLIDPKKTALIVGTVVGVALFAYWFFGGRMRYFPHSDPKSVVTEGNEELYREIFTDHIEE